MNILATIKILFHVVTVLRVNQIIRKATLTTSKALHISLLKFPTIQKYELYNAKKNITILSVQKQLITLIIKTSHN